MIMKLRTAALAGAAVLLLSGCGSDEPRQIPQPPEDSNVLDGADVLTDSQERDLERAIESGNDRSDDVRVAILTEDAVGGGIEDRARDVASAWGVGEEGRDDGVLVLLHPDEQEVRVEVAEGAQDVLPAEATDAIVDDRMVPAFEDERWSEGLQEGVGSLYATAAGEEDPTAGDAPWWVFALIIAVVVLIVGAVLIRSIRVSRRRRRIARENLERAEREDPDLGLTEEQEEHYVRWASHRKEADILPVAAWLPLYLSMPSTYGADPTGGSTGGDFSGGGSSFGGGGGFTGGGSTGSW